MTDHADQSKLLDVKPLKFAEKVFIQASGDRAVGIPSTSYCAECWVDPSDKESLEYFRAKFSELYGEMVDERVSVMFDFELEAYNAAMDKLEKDAP